MGQSAQANSYDRKGLGRGECQAGSRPELPLKISMDVPFYPHDLVGSQETTGIRYRVGSSWRVRLATGLEKQRVELLLPWAYATCDETRGGSTRVDDKVGWLWSNFSPHLEEK
ncbi:hypothetical protein MCOR27_005686 [Pyricularia oryzae]|uniref:Uncharacterized protein n=4 Tax=Pyricularia TaxID=48558 RepID=A0ABQ8NT07_PYRGI|nr:uncharacterized protein MGG_15762 [Pyricularia oryzae 70-15]ELQ40491.1 hypothetical protein OOU_Y34scaffold00433g35 [Pyricularia oryzae Y34]KAI6258111.1 hypothetical protein MCOR19_005501 [Pyricularia oryzae]KAI6301630.1 hypothetical protein MCOR33_002907 [Pyricularia grisea]EHA54925.1 hypothetical protein MGG_15762 [Pyricularia oryzae 70-15]KAI6268024.1 hypothetical protein MCOR26_009411 [Pyricularia oryzae]